MMDAFTNTFDEKIRPLMDKIDQVRSLLSSNDYGVTFPNVVVVGTQSSGKSTLLEALSLVELPKGTGIVTRCPLVLRLRKSKQRQVFHLQSDNKKVALDETKLNILKYIEEETKKLAGNQKNVVHDLIELQVEDPNVRDLTVVDLPGIAHNAVDDQPKDIHKQTTNLILKFISQPGSIILCMFPGNVDFATVESLSLAQKVDPSGIRTIGVITKSDLAPNHDVLVEQLLMEKPDVLKLKLGFIAVRNRSTEEKISLEDARKQEKDFFQQHPASAIVGWHCLGIDALINRLADLYADSVQKTYPKIRSDIQTKLKEVHEQLSKFPPNLETPSARLAKYHEIAGFYVENILKVRFSSSNDDQSSLINTLHERFNKFEKIIRRYTREILFSSKYRSKVRDAMSACFGEQLPNFLPHPVLKRLINEKLGQLWLVTETLIKECFRLTSKLLLDKKQDACKDEILLKKLLPAFHGVVILYLNEKERAVKDQLQDLIRLEKHDPYTINHYYMDKINEFKRRSAEKKLSHTAKKVVQSSEIDENDDDDYVEGDDDDVDGDEDDDSIIFDSISNDEQAVQEMLISLLCYWKVLTKRFIDYVTLSLRAGCVFDVCTGIRNCLSCIPTEQCDFVDSYLAEDAVIRTKRKQLQQTKERLEKVDAILGGHKIADVGSDIFAGATSDGDDSLFTLDAFEKSLSHTDINDDTDDIASNPVHTSHSKRVKKTKRR
jgi:GTPase SAR1 family protein